MTDNEIKKLKVVEEIACIQELLLDPARRVHRDDEILRRILLKLEIEKLKAEGDIIKEATE